MFGTKGSRSAKQHEPTPIELSVYEGIGLRLKGIQNRFKGLNKFWYSLFSSIGGGAISQDLLYFLNFSSPILVLVSSLFNPVKDP